MKSWSTNHTSSAELGNSDDMLMPDQVSIPKDGIDVWEIDSKQLRFEQKIAAGSFGEL